MQAAPPVPEETPSVAPAAEALTRGLNPLAALAFVRETAGDAGIKRVLGRLPEADLRILSGEKKLSAKTWVPFGLQSRLLTAIDQTLGQSDRAKLFDVGAFMAARDIPRVFRPLLRLGSPGWIIEVSTRVWRFYHSRGVWEIQRTPVTVLATLTDHPEADEAFCATFMGWLTGAVEMSGGYDVMVDHPVCHARGAPNCVFTVRWSLLPVDDDDDDDAETEIGIKRRESAKHDGSGGRRKNVQAKQQRATPYAANIARHQGQSFRKRIGSENDRIFFWQSLSGRMPAAQR